jgi:hypothetical protein
MSDVLADAFAGPRRFRETPKDRTVVRTPSGMHPPHNNHQDRSPSRSVS